MAGELLLDRPADGVLRLTISNPAKRNALDHAILDAIARRARTTSATPACVVLTGADGMFSSGYDIGDIPEDVFAAGGRAPRRPPVHRGRSTRSTPATIPTVAALPGHTIGGGLELALACDLRVAADGIELGMPPAKLGLVYSHTGLRRFIDAIGAPRTRELFLLGAQHRRAHGADLGTRQRGRRRRRPRERGARPGAEDLAANAPLSVRGNKRVIRELLAAEGALDPDVERELIELREASFAVRGHARGRARVRREAPGALEGALKPSPRT